MAMGKITKNFLLIYIIFLFFIGCVKNKEIMILDDVHPWNDPEIKVIQRYSYGWGFKNIDVEKCIGCCDLDQESPLLYLLGPICIPRIMICGMIGSNHSYTRIGYLALCPYCKWPYQDVWHKSSWAENEITYVHNTGENSVRTCKRNERSKKVDGEEKYYGVIVEK